MKRSAQVPASLIVALSAAISTTGCQNRECRDAMGRVIADSFCRGGTYSGAHWVNVQTGGFGGSGSGGSFGG
jgi:hypothetical protein